MQSPTPLYNIKWSLIKIHDNGNEEIVNTKAFIRIDKEKGSAGGNGSCNSFGSSPTINGNEVSFKNVFSTKKFSFIFLVQQRMDLLRMPFVLLLSCGSFAGGWTKRRSM